MRIPLSCSTALAAISLLAFGGSAFALTAPVMTISDSFGETVTIDSAGTIVFGGTCTPSICTTNNGGLVIGPGTITWSGSLHGSGKLMFANLQGMSKPALTSPQMSLSGRVNNNTGQPVTLTVQWSDTGFSPGESPATMTAAVGNAPINSGLNGAGTDTNVSLSAYVDSTNALFGHQTPINTLSFAQVTTQQSLTATGPGPSGDPFSMTQVESFTMAGTATQPTYFFDNFTVQASPYPPLAVACPVASGQAGFPYNAFLTATGGVPAYTFSIINGALPSGLTLDPASGAITGTAPTAGNYPFTAQVTDSSGSTANTTTSSCGITITQPPTPPVLACPASTGLVSSPYSSSLVATGGTQPYTFSIVSGSLPAGLFLNSSTGAVTGTPTSAGQSNFTAQVVDSSGNSDSSTVTTGCSINALPAVTSSCVVINAVQNVAIVPVKMSAGGGAGGPYTFTATGLPAGLTISADGTISGTPTVSGTFNYSVTITDSAGNTGTVNCSVTVYPPITVLCSSNSTGEVGAPFNGSAPTVSGGLAPYTYAVATGALPAGLTLNASTGAITGIPTATGSFTLQVTDSNGVTADGTCPYTIGTGLTVGGQGRCPAADSGEVGAPFNSPAPTITGGTGPFTFSVATGALPAGLTLNTLTGAVTGTPTATGTFTIQVTDGNGVTAAVACPYIIVAAPSLSCSSVATGEAGAGFNSPALSVSGGTRPFTFSVATGALPAGLTLNANTGAITGTPTAAGSFTLQVTDALGMVATGTCPYTIGAAPSLACSAISTGEAGTAFNSPAMSVTGGTGPFTFAVASGALPTGLTLNASNGAITGTPTAPGTFTISVTDALGVTAPGLCPFTISAGPSMACSATSTGMVGSPFNSPAPSITGGTAPFTFAVATGVFPAGLTLNPATGAITGTPTATGTFTIKVTDANGVIGDETCPFTITGAITGGVVAKGDTATIGFWHNQNGQALIDSLNGGPTATNLANWLATTFPYLYGVHSANNLTGKTNADVASLFLKFFGVSGQKTNAQILAGALAVYVTNSTLAGTVAGPYGFNVSANGTGNQTYNIGSDGTAMKLSNKTSYTVMQLLLQANLMVQNGTFNANAFNDVFSGINQGGDIN